MKVTVIARFEDRVTGVIHTKGQILDVTEERAMELAEKGKVEVVEESMPKKVVAERPHTKKKTK